ncbi:DNA phosphorothioation-associated putative methyltransferase [Colwellia sp. 1_MG-2023]|uniref:DNA phosphorothioation-associated putative methyltransferase n=1 Tax=unclassified Colwellia TaxID=196834 RepID=UPI001C09E808|nr:MULTISPECIES: DNA phosphorothioation-associated putative methyltransferase [unclassified Colwellia]MBU2925806.1 DNA phosphorothioation-associated putative methyltransferase [Colwellia sp. C2M11]MDO6650967.1 DNA phosphorothioation-associated putative methyltransferase [Colwellia sp. 3_MG-2023]MDO6664002.1 DNA phosphorothioation-associated putative methyltransferase [Colwellia sp. 2_MG-2023]MDO6688353.1 DNA phosphorothioation-associated putative methyltransferase [Colwellia sp. 1_MG-2023]
MKFIEYRELVKSLRQGKQLPTAIYLHRTAIDSVLPNTLVSLIFDSIKTLNITEPWNLLKLYKRDFKITLLDYPEFDTYAYPALHTSITIDIEEQTKRKANYQKSENPPILHRKETFVLANYPLIESFKAITAEGEAIELYKNTKTIGFKQQWQKLIQRKGYQLDTEGRLHPLAIFTALPNEDTLIKHNEDKPIARHLTAINRDKLSSPFQKLAHHNFLNGDYSIFDYGCGKGDDAKELEAHGLNIHSWDPVHKPKSDKVNSDIVNLGFVLNVIEDINERTETLKNAWQLSNQLLVVSVMLAGSAKLEQFTRYKDGVITKWNTFQKYYNQAEIRSYIEQVLKTKAVALGQGIFGIFKDKSLEEVFYLSRQYKTNSEYSNATWQQLTTKPKPEKTPSKIQAKSLYQKNNQLFDEFWQQCLVLGRIPANDEFECSDDIRRVIGSHKKAFELMAPIMNITSFEQSQKHRRSHVLVYFALSLFEKRKIKSHMPARLQRDIKALFQSYNQVIELAQSLLFSVGTPENINEACNQAFQNFQCGKLVNDKSYTFNQTLLNQMPAILRVYVGCAIQLYGDIDDIDMIKLHIRSGKVTLLKYDDFKKKSLPLLTERTKIRLHDLDIDFFFYGENYPYPPLYDKSVYLSSNSSEYKKQKRFENRVIKQLKDLPLKQLPDWELLQKIFEYQGVKLKGNKFYKSTNS